MTRRRVFVLILLIIGLILLMISCSNDPLVAPSKIFVLSISSEKNKILYDSDYNSRVIYLDIGETGLFTITTNRFCEIKNLKWSSNVPTVASVIERNKNEALITALDYGVSLISVRADGYYNEGKCYVIVNDKAADDGINITIDNLTGLIKSSDDKYELEAATINELSDKHLNLHYENNHNIVISRIEWYVNGLLYSTSETLDITFESFGSHTIDCIVYRNSNGVVYPVGTSSVDIKVNNI